LSEIAIRGCRCCDGFGQGRGTNSLTASGYANPDRHAKPYRYPSRYDRYAAADRYSKPGTVRKLVRHTILVTPPPRAEGRLLWLPSIKYERSFEGFEAEEVWELGCVIDFDDAAESAQWQGYDEGEDCRLRALGVGSERETFVADDWWHDGSSLRPELMEHLDGGGAGPHNAQPADTRLDRPTSMGINPRWRTVENDRSTPSPLPVGKVMFDSAGCMSAAVLRRSQPVKRSGRGFPVWFNLGLISSLRPAPQIGVGLGRCRHPDLDTRVGTPDLALQKPGRRRAVRDWLSERRKRAERALTSMVANCNLLGLSTRRVEALVQSLGVISPSR